MEGDVMLAADGFAIAHSVAADMAMTDGVAARIKARFKGVERLREQGKGVEEVTFLASRRTLQVGEEVVGDTTRYVFFAVTKGLDKDRTTGAAVFKCAKALRECLLAKGIDKLAITRWGASRDGLRWPKIKKIIEAVFSSTAIEILAFDGRGGNSGDGGNTPSSGNAEVQGMTKQDTGKPRSTQEERRQKSLSQPPVSKIRDRGEAVVVKIGDSSYADTLRTIKNGVGQTMREGVNKISRTRGGDIIIHMEKGAGKAEQLARAVKEIVGAEKMYVAGGKVKLDIADLDATITIEEVSIAVAEAIGVGPANVETTNLRQSYGGMQKATVAVTRAEAETLLNMRRIKAGWAWARIIARSEQNSRCFKCWDYGHWARECKGENREEWCLNCCQKDHRVRDCRQQPKCPLCEGESHRAGSAECRAYRRWKGEAVREIVPSTLMGGAEAGKWPKPGERH